MGILSKASLASTSLLSGLVLLSLLPIGIFSSLSGSFFSSFFFLHLILHLVAVLLGVISFSKILFRKPFALVFALIFFLIVFAVAAHSFLPPTARDALIHHLAVPKWWIEADRIVEIPWHEWSYYPMLLQLAFAGFELFGLTDLIALYHFSYAFLLSCLVLRFLYEETEDRMVALYGFFLLLTLPLVMKLSSIQLVDLGLAYYSALGFFLASSWAKTQKVSDLLMCGVSLGLAMGCKYNGFLFAAIFCLGFLFLSSRSKVPFLRSIVSLGVLSITALIVVSPWLIKNLASTDNPLYPLFGGFFGTAVPTPGVRGFKSIELRHLRYGEGIFDFFLLPLKMLIWGVDNNSKWFDGRLSPLLLFLFVPFVKIKQKPWCAFYLLVAVAYVYLALLYSGPRVRYLTPLLGIAVVLAAYGIWILSKRLDQEKRSLLFTLIFLCQFSWAGWYYWGYAKHSGVFAYLTEKKNEDDFFASKVSEYSFAKYANNDLPAEGVLYLLFTGNRFYYYDRAVRSGGHYASNEIIRWLHASEDRETFREQFAQHNIRYLGIHVRRLQQNLQSVLPKREAELWNAFQRESLKLIYYTGPYTLWEIQ